MSIWKAKLKEAKELLDEGFINEQDYEVLKQEALALRSQSTNPEITTPPISSAVQNLGTVVSNASSFESSILGGINNLGTMVDSQTLSSIGNYKLLGSIGQGGMGTVYRARHKVEAFAQQTGDVVIKLMNPQYAEDPTFRQRFITEAVTGRKIQHPNVVRIHDVIVEEHNNILAIVMDLVEGRPLEGIIPRGGLALKQALPIIEQMSRALDHLHSTGIIHRDLKPENIIVSPSGKPVILDMGIAKNTDSNLKMTLTSTAMGTPLYMAPEQTDAKNVTSAADRYAFGLIVYQMLSGRFPWDASSGPGMITAYKMMGNLTPLKEVQQVPGFVSDAVMKLLRANAGDRWDSCADFLTVFVESEGNWEKKLAADRVERDRIEREGQAAEEETKHLEEINADQEQKAREEGERTWKEENGQQKMVSARLTLLTLLNKRVAQLDSVSSVWEKNTYDGRKLPGFDDALTDPSIQTKTDDQSFMIRFRARQEVLKTRIQEFFKINGVDNEYLFSTVIDKWDNEKYSRAVQTYVPKERMDQFTKSQAVPLLFESSSGIWLGQQGMIVTGTHIYGRSDKGTFMVDLKHVSVEEGGILRKQICFRSLSDKALIIESLSLPGLSAQLTTQYPESITTMFPKSIPSGLVEFLQFYIQHISAE